MLKTKDLILDKGKIDDWKAADLYEDNKINVLDLCRMKFELIK